MGAPAASSLLLGDAISRVQDFVNVLTTVYIIVIFAYVLTGWIRLPYSPVLNRIQRFLYDVSEPYIRLFRRILPAFGPLDLSPMVAVIVLIIFQQVLIRVLDQFH
jgi:YggT family protein